jgi:hypothetical protein
MVIAYAAYLERDKELGRRRSRDMSIAIVEGEDATFLRRQTGVSEIQKTETHSLLHEQQATETRHEVSVIPKGHSMVHSVIFARLHPSSFYCAPL